MLRVSASAMSLSTLISVKSCKHAPVIISELSPCVSYTSEWLFIFSLFLRSLVSFDNPNAVTSIDLLQPLIKSCHNVFISSNIVWWHISSSSVPFMRRKSIGSLFLFKWQFNNEWKAINYLFSRSASRLENWRLAILRHNIWGGKIVTSAKTVFIVMRENMRWP